MNETKPLLIILAGPNGSGKTTIARAIENMGYTKNCTHINPDNIAQQKYGDWNNPQNSIKAAEVCDTLRYELLNQGNDIFFETVFSSPEKINFIKLAKEKGYFIRFFFVCTNSPDINAARISKRFRAGGHVVPIDKIVLRYRKSLVQAEKAIAYLDRAYFIDNSIEDAPPRLVFQTRKGILHKVYDEMCVTWHKKLLENLPENSLSKNPK